MHFVSKLDFVKYIAAGLVVIISLTGCGASEIQLNIDELESKIEAWAEGFVEGQLTVDCGEDRRRPSEAGSSFLCDLSDDTEFIINVEVTVLDEKGNIEFGAVE